MWAKTISVALFPHLGFGLALKHGRTAAEVTSSWHACMVAESGLRLVSNSGDATQQRQSGLKSGGRGSD